MTVYKVDCALPHTDEWEVYVDGAYIGTVYKLKSHPHYFFTTKTSGTRFTSLHNATKALERMK